MAREYISSRSGERIQKILINLPSRLIIRADRQAKKRGMSRTAIITQLLDKHLSHFPGRPLAAENRQGKPIATDNFDVVDCQRPYDERSIILNGQRVHIERR